MHIQLNDRPFHSLDGAWGFFPDPMGAFGKKRSRNVFEGRSPTEEDRAVEYDIDAMESLEVPGDWNTQKPELLYFEGFGWYARKFRLEGEDLAQLREAGRVFLRLEGVNYGVDAWWNGEKIGSAEIPFLPLTFEVDTDLIREENLLVIRVDARRREERAPSLGYDWFNYGGLIRSVRLVATPRVFVSEFSLLGTRIVERSEDSGAARVDASFLCRLEGLPFSAASLAVRLRIPDLDVVREVEVRDGECGVELAGLEAELWEPGAARLYRAEVELLRDGKVIDRVAQEVGFKQVEWDDRNLYVNKKRIFLRGMALHEERIGSEGGKPRNPEEIRALLDLCRRVDINFVRLAHYPYDEEFLRECDRRGLLYWDEIPVYWNIRYDDERTQRMIRESLARMIEVSRSHVSRLCHAVANETWEQPGRRETMRAACEQAREMDPDIPVAAAFSLPHKEDAYDLSLMEHSLLEFVDVVGLNEYGGWYSPTLADLARTRLVLPDKPSFITEFGGAGPEGSFGEPNKLWNQDNQAEIYRRQFELFERTENLCGVTPWVTKDFRSPLRANGFQKGWNRKGLFTECGRAKVALEEVRRYFQSKGGEDKENWSR